MYPSNDVIFVTSTVLYEFASKLHLMPSSLEDTGRDINEKYSYLSSGYSASDNMFDFMKSLEEKLNNLSNEFQKLEEDVISRAELIKSIE